MAEVILRPHFFLNLSCDLSVFKVEMSLTITRMLGRDYGKYKCVAKNPRGQTDGTISVYGNL